MNKQEIINAINEYIKTNGVQEITGQVMNLILNSIANIIPDDAMLTSSFGGIVNPNNSISFTPGLGRWFIAEAGKYPNHGGFTFENGNLNILSYDGINWQKSQVSIPKTSISSNFDPTTETEAQGGKQIYDFVINNNKTSTQPTYTWEQKTFNQGYIIDETIDDYNGYRYAKITDVANVIKVKVSGRSKDPAEAAIIPVYGRRVSDGTIEIIYNIANQSLVDYEIVIEQGKFSALYFNFRNTEPSKLEVQKKIQTIEKIYISPADLNSELNKNEKLQVEQMPNALYDYTMVDGGTYESYGSNYKHIEFPVNFKAGDKFVIEYVTNFSGIYHLFTFDANGVFKESLWLETTQTGGRKTKIFEPDFNGSFVLNSNFPNSLGLPKITKTSTKQRFLTPESSGGVKDRIYDIDSHYVESDGGDYGKTLMRIHGLMPYQGGVIFVNVKDYRIDTPVVFTKPVSVQGFGGMEFYYRSWFSCFYTNSGTIDMICCMGGSGKFIFTGIHFRNANLLPTAGSGLRLKSSTPASNSSGDKILSLVSGAVIDNCTFDGFYDNMVFDGACQWTLINPLSAYPVRYGLVIDADNYPDAGDSAQIGGNYYATKEWLGAGNNRLPKAHIFQKGSGGLKLTSIKFNNKAEYAILGEIKHETVILNVSNCSFENQTKGHIKYTKITPLNFNHVNISNNQFASYIPGQNFTDIDLRAGIGDINIIGNSFDCSQHPADSNTAINLNSVNRVRLMNTYHGYTTPINMFNCEDVQTPTLQVPTSTSINK